MNIFSRAAAGLNLTPGERAFLKLVEGLWATALVAALPVVAEALAQRSVDWTVVLHAALAAAVTAVVLAILKYAKAQGDDPLSSAVASAAQAVATDLQAGKTPQQVATDLSRVALGAAEQAVAASALPTA